MKIKLKIFIASTVFFVGLLVLLICVSEQKVVINKKHNDEKHIDEKHIDEKHIDEKHIDEKHIDEKYKAGLLGRSIKLLYGFEPMHNLIKISNNIEYMAYDNCVKTVKVQSSSSYKQWRDKYSNEFSIGGIFSIFTGYYTDTSMNVREYTENKKQVISQTRIECIKYKLEYHSELSINDKYLEELDKLPSTYSDINKHIFWRFFEYYGDHVIISCDVGGFLQKNIFTEYKYVRNYGMEKTTQEAGIFFFIGLDTKNEQNKEYDIEFEEASYFSRVNNRGGDFPTNSSWEKWIKSINNKKNLECVNWEAVPITHLLKGHLKHDVIDVALNTYFYSKLGCTNPKSSNYDKYALINDGTCIIEKCEMISYDLNNGNYKEILSTDTSHITEICLSHNKYECNGEYAQIKRCNHSNKTVNIDYIEETKCPDGQLIVSGYEYTYTCFLCRTRIKYKIGCADTVLLISDKCKTLPGKIGILNKCPVDMAITEICIDKDKGCEITDYGDFHGFSFSMYIKCCSLIN